jgi:4-phytase/acid phosphatase
LSKNVGKFFILACFVVVVWVSSAAQTSGATAASHRHSGQLKMVVILSRHGVRSPTWTQDRLNAYSSQPWPDWTVPPGYLTSRGFELVKLFGSYDREALAKARLIAADGCSDAAQIYIWADTDQRTLESGRALAEGMFPGCAPVVHSLPAGKVDPLFHPASTGEKRMKLFTAAGDADARGTRQYNSQEGELLEELNRVLLGCAAKMACAAAHAPSTPLVPEGSTAASGNGKSGSASEDALALSSTFAEDFLLEYAEGMPSGAIGWGHVDEQQLRRFLQLHCDYFERTYRSPAHARIEASTMLTQIVRTLEQAVEQHPVEGAIGPVNTKLLILSGHDTNIAAVAALLGLHWNLDGRMDDTPPGMELSFELWQDRQGAWSVQLKAATQTLQQLRTAQKLTLAAPPAHRDLTMESGQGESREPTWEDFKRTADAAAGKDVAPTEGAK